jgi:hypothetical protein
MGQYHKLVNIDKQEQVISYTLGLGAKQYEQTGFEGSMSDALYLLLMTSPARGGGDWEEFDGLSGRWAGDRVLVLGDYSTDEDLPTYPDLSNLWQESSAWTNISTDVAIALSKVFKYEMEFHTDGWAKRIEKKKEEVTI